MPVPPLLKRALYTPDMLDANRKSDPMEIARSLFGQVPEESLLNKILFFDIHSYAPDDLMVKVDRMTRAHVLDAVSPYHDRRVVELAARLPDELKIGPDWERKVVMRRAFGHLLPERTLKKKKQGFAMPIGEWLVKNLREYVREILLDGKTLRRGYFRPVFLSRMLDSFFSGESDYASGSESTVMSLLTMELWHRRFIDG
jgi:asparagine synthase (glutamine-hydrolysing)